MLLADIRQYLKERGVASLDEVAIHFDIATDAAMFALDYWEKKGKLVLLGAACGSSCGGCNTGGSYRWKIETITPIWHSGLH